MSHEEMEMSEDLESVSDYIERSLAMPDSEVDGLASEYMQKLGCSKKEAQRLARVFQNEMNGSYWD